MSDTRHAKGGAPHDPAKAWRRLAIAIVFGATASGCAPKALYGWGRYEESLTASYLAHDEAAAWSSLEATLTSAHETGDRIPPGACAEFAFLLYKRGERERAIQYFEQEAQLFIESKPLMERLVARVREKAAGDGSGAQEETSR